MQAVRLLPAAPATAGRRPCANRRARPRLARCAAEAQDGGRVSEPARAHVQALMAELAGGPAADGASAVRVLTAQLQAAQDALARLQDESSGTIQALRTVAERLSEEKLRADAALAAKSRCAAACRLLAGWRSPCRPGGGRPRATRRSRAVSLTLRAVRPAREQAAAVEATTQHALDLAAAQERHEAALREERARVRAAEALLAEAPPPEELVAQQQAATARLASAVARVVELERELSTVQDTVVSERVEQLVARVRALEAELAEQEGGTEELAVVRASAAAAAKRAAELEAASARSDRTAEVERLVAQNKQLEQALQAQRSAAVAPALAAQPPAVVAAPTKQPAAAGYPDDIQSQLKRIEALLESLPAPSAAYAMVRGCACTPSALRPNAPIPLAGVVCPAGGVPCSSAACGSDAGAALELRPRAAGTVHAAATHFPVRTARACARVAMWYYSVA